LIHGFADGVELQPNVFNSVLGRCPREVARQLGRLYNVQKRAAEADQEFKKFQTLDKNPANREFPITDR
jgi:hypothetical protein